MINRDLARTLADLDQATETLEETLTSARDEHYRVQEIAAELVTQCHPRMIVDALGKTGLRNLRRLIDIDPTYTRETTPKTTQQATERPAPVDAQPVKQTRKTTRQTTTPKGWESVEA